MKKDIVRAGDLLSRRQRVLSLLEIIDKEIEAKLSSDSDADYLIGRYDALKESANQSHLKLVKQLIITKQDAKQIEDISYLDFEHAYLQGYASGLQTIINIDREVFKAEPQCTFLILCEDADYCNIIDNAFRLHREFAEHPSDSGLQFKIVSTLEDLIKYMELVDENDNYIVDIVTEEKACVNYEKFKELTTYSEDRIFLAKCNSDNVEKIVNKLVKATSV